MNNANIVSKWKIVNMQIHLKCITPDCRTNITNKVVEIDNSITPEIKTEKNFVMNKI